jgi:putative DNA primase/helicase
MTPAAEAPRYIRMGWPVILLRGKLPLTPHGSKDATLDLSQAAKWAKQWPDANIGVATGHRFFVMDVDVKGGGEESFDALRHQHGPFPNTIEQITGTGGRHLLFLMPDFPVRNSAGVIAPGIDIRGLGGYIVVAPSIHPDTKRAYVWDGLSEIEQQTIAPAPAWLLEKLRPDMKAQRPAKAVPRKISEGSRNTQLYKLACSQRRKGLSEFEILATLRASNQTRCSPPLPEGELVDIAKSSARHTPDQRSNVFDAAGIAPPTACVHKDAPDLLPFLYNDHGNSLRLVAMFGEDLSYCPPIKSWMCWDGRRWAPDEEGRARRFAKAMFCELLGQAIRSGNGSAEKFARECLDTKRITNVLREAQDLLCRMPAEFDTDPYALNFQNGTVDLRTGQIRPHRREKFISKVLAYHFDPQASCARFLRFLDEVMGIGPDAAEAAVVRGHELVAFLQRAIGYSLTAVTAEKVIFFLHGPRDNGKTTLLATILTVWGEYGMLLSIETLMAKSGAESNNAAADLADLRGARFVMTSETDQGNRLAEGRLKRITQGMGKIKACRKYENPIEFLETHKLWVDANFLPVVRSGDEAIWRRLRVIPFSVVIPRERQDRELGSKLLAEAEGILAWAVAGAVVCYRNGLGTVAPVEEHSNAWRDDMNQVLRFVDEACARDKAVRVRARDLFHGYTRWSEGGGERSMTERSFSLKLIDLGFERGHDERGNYYVGIGLRVDQGVLTETS